jgi:hypothetical protein
MCKKLVLVGDTQLPQPTIISPLVKSKGAVISLFERLLNEGYPLTTYSNQSILHPPLVEWISNRFYGSRLKVCNISVITPVIKGFPWPSALIRFCLVQCKGK